MKATQPPKSPHLVFPLRLFLAFQMLPPQLFPDLSAPSGSLPGSSTWSLFSSSLLSSLPLLVNSESWIQLSNPPLRCTLRVLCSLSFWDTHGGKQLHLLQAYSRLPRQSWERWCNLAEHFNSCFFLPQSGSALPGNPLCFLRAVCFPHFWQHHLKSLFLPSNLLVFSGPYWLFRENRNHLMETTSTSC